MEMRRGPTYCNRRLARECFEMAIETAKTSSHPKAKEIQQLASQRLRLLDRAGEAAPRTPEFPRSGRFCRHSAGVHQRPVVRGRKSSK